MRPASGEARVVVRRRPAWLRRASRRLDVGHLRAGRWGADPGPITLVGVYRARNADRVLALCAGIEDVRLWALDEVAPSLAGCTRGSGPGLKFPLLDLLLAAPARGTVVVADDDVTMVRGSVRELVALGLRAGLDVWQPAHHERVNAGHPITVRHPRSLVRRTHFVEIGPMFVLAPGSPLLPLPEGVGMGWGFEASWGSRSLRGELDLGIVDHVTLLHHGAVGADYDRAGEQAQQAAVVASYGLTDLDGLMVSRDVWRTYRARPPW